MTDNIVRLRKKLKPVEARITDRTEQQKSEEEAEFVRYVAEDIKNRKLQEAQDREALQKNPKWQQLFDDPDWKRLESQLAKEEALKAEACREWNGRAWHCLTPDEQKRAAEVQLPFDQKINKIKTSMFKMKDAAGLIETINLLWQGRDILSPQDLLAAVRDYLPAVEMLETLGQGSTTSVADNVNTYRQAAERIRLQLPGACELLPRQDVPSEELHNLEVWAEVEIKKNSQQKHKEKPMGEVGSSNSIVGAGLVSQEIKVTTPPFSDSKELNDVFADINQCLQTLEALSSHYNLLFSLERTGKVWDIAGSVDGKQFASEDDRRAHDDVERLINAATEALGKPLARVFAWGRDQRLYQPFDANELTSQIPYSWWDDDENRGHYEYYAFMCEQYQSELDRISKALSVVARKDSVTHIVLESYSHNSPAAIAEVTILTLHERQIVLEALRKATPTYKLTFRVLYEAHLLPADLILFQQRRDSLQTQYRGWKLSGCGFHDRDTFNAKSNAEDFIKRVIAMRPTDNEKLPVNASPVNDKTPLCASTESIVAVEYADNTVSSVESPKLTGRAQAVNVSDDPKNCQPKPQGIAQLLSGVPALNTADGSWVRCKLAASLQGIETRTLAKYRSQGESTPDKMGGRDPQLRLWRRQGTPSAHPWYLKSSLASQSKS